MKQLTFVQTRDMLLHVADQVIDSKAFLTEIDSKIGDGDHGIGMERGMKKAKEKLLPMENGDNVFSLFQEMGKTMLMSMGGASGVIFGTLFMGGAKGKTASSLTASGLISLMEDSLRSIQERGKAQTGDKTMVDALVPAVDSMKNSGSDDLGELLSAGRRGRPPGYGGHQKLSSEVWKSQVPPGAGNWVSGRRRHVHLDHFPCYGGIRSKPVKGEQKCPKKS